VSSFIFWVPWRIFLSANWSVAEERVIGYLLGVGGRGLVGGGPGHGGIPADEGAGPLKLYPKELNEVGSLGFNSVCAGAGIAKACIYVAQ